MSGRTKRRATEYLARLHAEVRAARARAVELECRAYGGRCHAYILDGHEAVPATMREAAEAFGSYSARLLAETHVVDVVVSTVFLSFDHGFGFGDWPLLFETMVFATVDGARDFAGLAQWRYGSWDQANAGHASIVAALEAGVAPGDLERCDHDA